MVRTMMTIIKNSTFVLTLMASTLGLLACDEESSDELMTRGAELDPQTCGKGVALPKGAEVVVSSKNTLLVSYPIPDAIAGISGAGSTEYTCSCGGSSNGDGKCYPKLIGNEVFCSASGCDSCNLNSSIATGDVAVARLTAQCGAPMVDEELVASRVAKVQDWTSQQGFPQPELTANGREATAPDGYGLVLERVGGRSLVYAVPESLFDQKTGELLKAVGPQGDAENMPLQVAVGGKAKCYCSAGGSCSFTSDGLCADSPGHSCSGSCTISGKGLKPGKIFEPSP